MIPIYYNLRSLAVRRVSTAVTVLGLALVVFVFAAVLMLSNGIEEALRSGGRPDNIILLREGALSEIASAVDRDSVRAIEAFPELATTTTGAPMATGEVVVLIALPRGDAFINATARGVTPVSHAARPGVSLAEGRAPRPGTFEVAIGTGLVGRSPGAFVGGELSFARARWPVVGRLAGGGSAYESEIWADRDKLASAYDREGFSSALVRLSDASRFAAFEAKVAADPRFTLKATREDAYWAEQASGMATFIRVLGLFVAVVFSGGAILGAMITGYSQVAARTRELSMMRAIGFRGRSVLASFVLESALLGLSGGVLGAAMASSMGLVKIRTLNFQTFSEVRFGFAPTAGILVAAVAFGLIMGVLGGFLPAVRAARLPILEATRG